MTQPFATRDALRRGLLPVALLLVATMLGGCQSSDVTGSIRVPDDYRQRHPILVGQQLETLDIPVGPEVPRLADRMRGNITGFAQKYRLSGASTLAIVVPSHSPSERVARGIAHQAADALVAAGVPRRMIDYRTYPAGIDDAGAPVRLAFHRIGAHVDDCGRWPDSDADIGSKLENRSYYNFGCATQQNLAASVVDPLDLLYPRGMAPADAARRGTVLGNYEQGQDPLYRSQEHPDTTTGGT